jgi:hypothetical protein
MELAVANTKSSLKGGSEEKFWDPLMRTISKRRTGSISRKDMVNQENGWWNTTLLRGGYNPPSLSSFGAMEIVSPLHCTFYTRQTNSMALQPASERLS